MVICFKVILFWILTKSNFAKKFLRVRLRKMINEYDIKSVMEDLKVKVQEKIKNKTLEDEDVEEKDTYDLIALIKLLRIAEIKELKEKYNDTKKLEILDRIKNKEREVAEIEERYLQVLNEECAICCLRMDVPSLYTCCQFIVCDQCVRKIGTSCPQCRTPDVRIIEPSSVREILEMKPPKEEEEEEEEVLTEKLKKIIDASKSTIIFTTFSSRLPDILESYNAKELRGDPTKRQKIIKEYRDGVIKVIFLNTTFDNSGIRLPNTTDIIFLDQPSEPVENQIVGRAFRLGREKNAVLKLHYMHIL